MAIFERRKIHPKKENNYRKYHELVREDFSECCAYCLIHEILGGGKENYELDHYRPKSLFPHLINDFFNIYYSCHVCNRNKSNSWPSSDLEQLGYCFVDPCNESFSEHFIESENGRWLPHTNAGRYTVEKLRLNRKHLIDVRGLLRRIADEKGTGPINWNLPIKDQIS